MEARGDTDVCLCLCLSVCPFIFVFCTCVILVVCLCVVCVVCVLRCVCFSGIGNVLFSTCSQTFNGQDQVVASCEPLV